MCLEVLTQKFEQWFDDSIFKPWTGIFLTKMRIASGSFYDGHESEED